MIDVRGTTFRDKVYGCWLGKNCGGTLGQPLEKAWGESEPFDVWWYPELQEGGIPNDDLEMQLIWLKALEEVGPQLKAADLAQYWLDHIGYNWDEYGLSKTNLKLGLLPPVSGAYNNWFKDCMGCPIRSEIWACIAPGLPAVAVRYAYEDAICDHAGGESVFGELFNAALEAAAFVIGDREQLLEIANTYIPAWSKTAQAIAAARAAHAAGEDWKTARQRVLTATPHHVAQYSPINIAFQVIGWLYGKDFGDALCIAVNCGYDTDCTGATLGSILGIIAGRKGLPERWTAPLGETIATNESWGGLRHASDGSNPVPTNLAELTERLCVQAERILAEQEIKLTSTDVPVDPRTLYAPAWIETLWSADPMRIDYPASNLHVGVAYGDSPAIQPDAQTSIITHLTNPHPDMLHAQCELRVPAGWTPAPQVRELDIPAHSSVPVSWELTTPPAVRLLNTNRLSLSIEVASRPAQPDTPVILIGAHKYRYTGPFLADGRTDRELFDAREEPEQPTGPVSSSTSRSGNWHDVYSLDNAVPLKDVFVQAGSIYAQTFLWSPDAREVYIGVATTCPAKLWVNGSVKVESFRYRPLRPGYYGDSESYCTVPLVAGWNEVLLKFVRSAEAAAFEAHLLISSAESRLRNGLPQIGRTRAPWDT
ncbi:MAG: ADP-ribosylglycohydrolase family protein [Herpetosiphonaceae bacterium]|nr:ADP-ribosylglycohydrolase family protein [Herpetosiphonaceae bacterium]